MSSSEVGTGTSPLISSADVPAVLSSLTAKVSRRSVLRGVLGVLAASGTALFGALVSRQRRLSRSPRRVSVPPDNGDAVTLMDDVIVCRGADGLKVFAAKCTHLGCRINRVADGLLVCPCHGSRFRPDGSVASGPATRPLEALAIEIDRQTGAMSVHVS
jgi:nitrite reductase/ring-hydroxylating ferredoxin subunit